MNKVLSSKREVESHLAKTQEASIVPVRCLDPDLMSMKRLSLNMAANKSQAMDLAPEFR
jgi:hypothetical protein